MESQSAFMLNRRFEPLGRPFFSSSPASIPNWVDSRSPRLIKYDRFQLALLNGSRHFDVGGFVGEWMGVKGRSGVRKWGCLAIWGFQPETFFPPFFPFSHQLASVRHAKVLSHDWYPKRPVAYQNVWLQVCSRQLVWSSPLSCGGAPA